MRKILLASTAIFIGGQVSALAAAPPPAYSWTGCYIGGHIGGAWGRNEFSDPGFNTGFSVIPTIAPPGGSIGIGSNANPLGGIQAGCDYQFMSNWIVGAAGDFSWTNINGQTADPFFAGKHGAPITLGYKTDSLATVTGRVGYAWQRYLVYAKGGGAWARDHYDIQNLESINNQFCGASTLEACNPTANETRFGWTIGGGFEWALAPNWSAMVEYNHYGFGTKTLFFDAPNSFSGPTPLFIKQSVDVIKVGANFRFGMGR